MNEGLKVVRLLMVLSSISPLFILWAIRGDSPIPLPYFLGACAVLVVLPNAALWRRIVAAKRSKDIRLLRTGTSEDHRDHLLVYLFSMLLPFYSADSSSIPDFIATLVAIAFIVYLFWALDLHYINVIFALGGYRVFTVYPAPDASLKSGHFGWVLITKRIYVPNGHDIRAYRLSDTVFLEVQ